MNGDDEGSCRAKRSQRRLSAQVNFDFDVGGRSPGPWTAALPEAQGQGVGTELLDIAKRASARLQLWTFQRNAQARRFYEARGFVLVEQTDGAGNEEKEPDARYLWMRAGAP